MRVNRLFFSFILAIASMAGQGQQVNAPEPQSASISGFITDVEGAAVPGAIVTVDGPSPGNHRKVAADGTGFFELTNLAPAVSYRIAVSAKGFSDWASSAVVLEPGQALEFAAIKLKISAVTTSVDAITVEQLAIQQVKEEEKQRIFGVIPNFYIAYDKNTVPLTTKLKYKLALKTATDVVSIAGDLFIAGINQAADTPDYQQGAKGYAQRFGAAYADSFSNVLIGGAVLPSLLHQDPRYFYQGTGTRRSRIRHAISSPFVCKGDNGRWQFNASSLGGDLITASLANAYYPESNRGAGLVFSSFLISTGGRVSSALVQEFIWSRHTTHSKRQTED